MLGALSLLVHFLGAVESVPVFRAATEALSKEPLLAVLVAATLALAAHSSIAIVLFIVSLGSAGIVGGEGALALVLGANLGAAVSPVMEASGSAAARCLPFGNLLVRASGCLLTLPLLPFAARSLSGLGLGDLGSLAVAFHVALNVVLAVVVLPWTGMLARLVTRFVPEPPRAKVIRADELPHHLNEAALSTPGLALTNATLEALHMANLASAILREALSALHTGDRSLARAIGQRDQAIESGRAHKRCCLSF
jgi:phosphate:Na+ symporter